MSVDAFAAAFPFPDPAKGVPGRCSTELLIQLGLPGTDSLAIWYARGLTDDEPPQLGEVLGPNGRAHKPVRVDHVREGQCGVYQIRGLEPDTSYQVALSSKHGSHTLSARTAPSEARPFSLLAFSCYAPFAAGPAAVKETNENTLLAMQRAAQRPAEARPAFALGMGDQVYVDDGAWRPFSAPPHSLLQGARGARFAYPREAADDYFDRLYRAHFSLAPFDGALAAVPSAMIWDDHELRAGWGSLGDEADPHWREHAAGARKHFLAYQLLRSARCFRESSPFGQAAWAPDADGRWSSLHYSFDWGPQTTFFVMDQRSQRAGPGGVLGTAQNDAIRAWLDRPGRVPRLYVLVSPIPLTTPGWFRVDPMGWTSLRRDERGDRWWAEANRSEAHALLQSLVDRFKRSHDRLLILSGDVHYSDVRELRLPRSSTVFGHEVISSGLAQSRYQTWNPFYELDEWQPAFPKLLESSSLGRHRHSGFAELHVTPNAGQAPSVRVLFHLGDSSREAELSPWLGPRDQPDAQRKWQPFELCPVKHGALLDTKPRSPAAEGPVQSCKRALGADRVRAVIAHEREFIAERRRARGQLDGGVQAAISDTYPVERALSGLALSGGGIRSATVCIGFMQVLQRAGQLADFDYVSSVSGGSFANGYLQVMSSPKLRARARDDTPPDKILDQAFSDEAVEQLYEKSRYLARGTGLTGAFNLVRLATSFGTSLIQHWLWLGSVLLTLGYLGQAASRGVHDALVGLVALGAVTVLVRMLVAHDLRGARPRWQRSIENFLNQSESVIAIGLVILGGPQLWTGFPGWVERQLVEVALWVNQKPTTAPSFVVCTATLAFLLPLLLCLLWKRDLMVSQRLEQGFRIGVLSVAGVWLASLLAGILHTALSDTQAPGVDLAALRAAWQARMHQYPRDYKLLWSACITAFLTLITSPNSTSLHRYYAARVADAFLIHRRRAARPRRKLKQLRKRLTERPLLLRHLTDLNSQAPYPLFNGCVNLVGKDPEFAGDQTSDYFVFAPHHCGAKLLGFASTANKEQYGRLSLAEAVTCSGAAISPFQGRSMPSATSILLWLLNLRTDVWLPNPGRPRTGFWAKWLDAHTLPWGPLRQLLALVGKLDTRARFVNVSDGGFIDNLGVYELLRRRCQRIVVVDATWDTRYEFEYLRNLIVRARQELRIDFVFDEQPEEVIKPRVSDGLSTKCVLRAHIKWPDGGPDGTLYYVKAALSRERTRSAAGEKVADPSRAYATYHPSFPQESTGDQFFDPVQSRAYHELGRQLAGELLQMRAWQREQADAAE